MQQVNFLKALPKKINRISAVLIGWIVLAIFAVLVLISLIVGVGEYQAGYLLKDSKKRLIAVQKDYEKISKAYPLLTAETPLIEQVKDLEQTYKASKDEFESLEELMVRRGFSEYMLGLAEAAPTTLWLNEIHINHNLDNISLSGYSIRSDTVSELMGNLLTTPPYSNVIFTLFFIKTIKNHPYVKFSIATKELGAEEEKVVEATDQSSQKPKE